jgi:hypothetical protein
LGGDQAAHHARADGAADRAVGGVRADAARNLDTLMQAGVWLLARDPSTSMAAIAAEATKKRRQQLRDRLDAFVTRATDEGLFAPGLPPGWARRMLDELVHIAAHSYPDWAPPQAADLVVDTLLKGIG